MHDSKRLVCVAVAVLLGLFACGGSDEDDAIRASDYDQSCAADTDCVQVAELEVTGGDGCSGSTCNGTCTDVAINVRDKARYDEDREATYDGCGGHTSPFCEFSGRVGCIDGRCAVVR